MLYKNWVYVPNIPKVKLLILNEVHRSPYSRHPGYQKIITMLRKEYFWPNMKNEFVGFLARCIECQQVKSQHQHTAGILQPWPIPNWKWEVISLDFVTGLPKNEKPNDSLVVVVDKLRKHTLYLLKQLIKMLTLLTYSWNKSSAYMEF